MVYSPVCSDRGNLRTRSKPIIIFSYRMWSLLHWHGNLEKLLLWHYRFIICRMETHLFDHVHFEFFEELMWINDSKTRTILEMLLQRANVVLAFAFPCVICDYIECFDLIRNWKYIFFPTTSFVLYYCLRHIYSTEK